MARLLGALALALAASPTFLVTAATSPYQITLDSYSCELDYWPNANGNASDSWNASYTGTPWSKYIEETVPEGQGYHWHTNAARNNGSVWVGYTFYGSAVEYWGFWAVPGQNGQGSVNVTDEQGNLLTKGSGESGSQFSSSAPTKLAEVRFDQVGNHTTRLIPVWGTVSFTHLVVTLELNGTAEVVSKAASNPTDMWFADMTGPKDAARNSSLPVSYGNGNWVPTPTIGAQGNGPEVTYPRMGTTDSYAEMTTYLGQGNIFMRLNGTSAWNHGVWQIDMDPAPPGRDGKKTYWAFTPWSVINTTYWAVALDPAENYTMKLTNLASEGGDATYKWLELATVTLWKDPAYTEKKSKVNAGAIAGGVVAGVVGALLIGAAIWFFLRRRRNKAREAGRRNESGRLTPIDYDPAAPVPTPYMSQAPSMDYTANPSYRRTSLGDTLLIPTDSSNTDRTSRTSDYFGGSHYAGSSTGPQPVPVSSVPRKGVPPPTTQHHPQQAADAGTLHPLPPQEEDMVPPSYNPEWSQSVVASAARNGGLGAPQIPEGATQRNSMQAAEPSEVDIIKAQFTRPRADNP